MQLQQRQTDTANSFFFHHLNSLLLPVVYSNYRLQSIALCVVSHSFIQLPALQTLVLTRRAALTSLRRDRRMHSCVVYSASVAGQIHLMRSRTSERGRFARAQTACGLFQSKTKIFFFGGHWTTATTTTRSLD